MKIDDLDPKEQRRLNILLWLVACGFFMQTLDATIVNTALPSMAFSLHESPLKMQSVVVIYSMAMAMLIPASGWISDRFGIKLVYLCAIFFFVVGSVLCAASTNLTDVLLARALQGFGGAMLLPVGRLSILRSFPRHQFLQAMSFIAVPGMIGPLIGPALGGWLVQNASWQWIFLINLPVGAIGFIASAIFMKEELTPFARKFDWFGYLLLATTMDALCLAIDGRSGLGLEPSSIWGLSSLGLLSLSAYVIHAFKNPSPLFSLKLFNTSSFGVGLFGNLFSRLGGASLPFLVPLMLQITMNFSPLQAGLMMLPAALTGMLMKPLTTSIIFKLGYKRVLLINTILVALSMLMFIWATPSLPTWIMILTLAVFGGLNSLQFTAMNTLTLIDLEKEQASAGNALLAMVQMLAMGMGVAIAGLLLNTFVHLTASDTLLGFHCTFAVMGGITLASTLIYTQLKRNSNTWVDNPPQGVASKTS
jgi:EmrB/QacA subfamily drug resistance transporter